jgi:toxin HigB-1
VAAAEQTAHPNSGPPRRPPICLRRHVGLLEHLISLVEPGLAPSGGCTRIDEEPLFGSVNSKAARRIPNTAWRAAQRKLKQLDLVATLDDLKIAPGNDLHALKGGQAGRHAIRVNDQYRITFRWEGHDAFDVRCEDYH